MARYRLHHQAELLSDNYESRVEFDNFCCHLYDFNL